MTARERRTKWLERKAFKKNLGIQSDASFYIVSDYGYEDCGYVGPFSFDEVITEWTEIHGHPPSSCDFKNTSGMRYITSDKWRLDRIKDRQTGW